MNHSTDQYEAACRDLENILEVFEAATVTIKVTDYNNLLDRIKRLGEQLANQQETFTLDGLQAPFTWVFTDVDGKPVELAGNPLHRDALDLRVYTPLYTHTTKENDMNEHSIEKEIKEKGLAAPRLTPEKIDATIAHADYHVFAGSCLTVCCLTLKNGFTVTGESACASPENFDSVIGCRIARENARQKIWMLEGYLLKDKLSK